MDKIAIMTDTASDIGIADIEKYDIKMLHYQIVYKDRILKDQVEISSKEVLDGLSEEVPTTSLPALDEIHDTFKEIQEEGYNKVIVIPLSSGLSGCYNAINMVKDEYPELDTHVYDSRTISAAQGVLAIKAAKMAKEGYSVEEILKKIDEMRNSQHTLFIVDTLKYLLLGGRIGHVSAALGTILNLKPIITIGDDGKYTTVAKVRGLNKAINNFIEEVKKVTADEGDYEIYFTHADGKATEDKIIRSIKEIDSIKGISGESWISPVACVHCGPGYVGMLIQREIV